MVIGKQKILFPFCNLVLCLNDGVLCNVEASQFYGIPFINCCSYWLCYWWSVQKIFFWANVFKTNLHFLWRPYKYPNTYRQLIFDKETRSTHWQKRQHLPKIVLVKLDGCMQKNANRHTLITWHKIQLQMDQRPQHSTRYAEPDRRALGFIRMAWDTTECTWEGSQKNEFLNTVLSVFQCHFPYLPLPTE